MYHGPGDVGRSSWIAVAPDPILSVMACNDMGEGKSFQTYRALLNYFIRRDSDWEILCEEANIRTDVRGPQLTKSAEQPSVLVILHRISLINSLSDDYLAKLNFQRYDGDDMKGTIYGPGLHIICINSLWRISDENEYDLVIIDEISEVLDTTLSLKQKHGLKQTSSWAIRAVLITAIITSPARGIS